MIEEFGLPRLVVINKMDRENASFGRTLESVQQFFGRQAVPVQIPIGEEKNFGGVIDLVGRKAYVFEKDESGKFAEQDDPRRTSRTRPTSAAKELIEMIAESDEKLMEKYLEKGELTPDEVRDGLKKAILSRQLFPVFAASALLNIGAQTLLDGVVGLHAVPGRPGRDRGHDQRQGRAAQAVRRTPRSPPSSSRRSPTPIPAGSP